jgi:flagellar motor switch protein FliN/FliY
MSDALRHDDDSAEDHNFREELTPAESTSEHYALDDLAEVSMTVTADLGKCHLYVRDILELARGSILQMDKLAGEMADISFNGVPFAKGEVVVIGDNLSIRIAEIYGVAQRDVLADD